MTADRRALVLGASQGIGAAIARRLDADGFDVTIVARSVDGLAATASSMHHATEVAIDLATVGGRDDLEAHLAAAGQPHVVVGVAHVRRPWSRVADTDPQAYGSSVDDHLAHLVAVARGAIPFQRSERFGRWILVGSLAATLGGHGQSVYVAQKSAMEGLARSLAVEEGRHGITANVVVPGFVDTENTLARYSSDQRAAFGRGSAVRRAGTPEEVAHAVSFLADERAGFVTGASIPVTGGAELGWWLGRAFDDERGAAAR